MTRYELLRQVHDRLRVAQALRTVVPGIGVGLIATCAVSAKYSPSWGCVAGILALLVSSFILHYVWRCTSDTYRGWCSRLSAVNEEMAVLQKRVDELFARHRKRRKGEQFKIAYGLAGLSIGEFEEAIAVGMLRERKEVFVTAFVREGIALRVTAAIGSAFRCSNADNPARWRAHSVRLKCDQVRQYHNHPHHGGKTRPSSSDCRSSEVLADMLGSHAGEFRSFVLCWNAIREWKVFEYDEAGTCWLHSEFDVASWS